MSQPSVAEVYRSAIKFDLRPETSNISVDDILTPEELAERLKVDVSWIYEKRRPRCKNPIPAIPMGKTIRFDWDKIVSWLQAQAEADEKSIALRRRTPIKRRGK